MFERQRRTSFESFINRDIGKLSMPELLATFTDKILRKGGHKEDEAKTEDLLKQIVNLFTHLVDKDLFIEVYRNYLSKRLLNEKSASMEMEKAMISHVKLSCGPLYTKKLEGMISDMNLARESRLKEDQPAFSDSAIDFNIVILTTSYWPTYKQHEISIPREIETCTTVYNLWY